MSIFDLSILFLQVWWREVQRRYMVWDRKRTTYGRHRGYLPLPTAVAVRTPVRVQRRTGGRGRRKAPTPLIRQILVFKDRRPAEGRFGFNPSQARVI